MGRISDLCFTARSILASSPAASLHILKSDYRSAYRGCPISAEHFRFSTILVLDPSSNELCRFTQLAMPFGAVAAVYSWDRLGSFMQAVLMELFDLPLSRFVDDLFMLDFTDCSALARAIMLEVIDALGFTLEVDKTPLQLPLKKFSEYESPFSSRPSS
jgi:hypothetical protein